MKTCYRCGDSKPLGQFYRDASNKKDGRQSRCRECARATLQEWQATNRPRTRASARRYYQENRSERRAYRERYYRDNREAVLTWFRQRPERDAAKQHERRGRLAGLASEDVEYIAILRCDPCAYCGDEAGTIDHLEPLSSGGSGGWENLTASCRSCNSSKRTAALLAFLAARA